MDNDDNVDVDNRRENINDVEVFSPTSPPPSKKAKMSDDGNLVTVESSMPTSSASSSAIPEVVDMVHTSGVGVAPPVTKDAALTTAEVRDQGASLASQEQSSSQMDDNAFEVCKIVYNSYS